MGLIGKIIGTAVVAGTLVGGAYLFKNYASHSPTIQRYLGNTKTAEQLSEARKELTDEVSESTIEAVRDITGRFGEWRGDVRDSWGEYRESAAEAREVQEELK